MRTLKDNTVSLSFQIENAEITLLFSSNGPIQDIDSISQKPEITLCHSHPVHEMFIVMSGEMIFTDNIKDILLKTRDVCIVPPGLFIPLISLKSAPQTQSEFQFSSFTRRLKTRIPALISTVC